MCGLICYYSDSVSVDDNFGNECSCRGPDETRIERPIFKNNLFMKFHRLEINDLTKNGSQPMTIGNDVIFMCNGEIYNFRELRYYFERT